MTGLTPSPELTHSPFAMALMSAQWFDFRCFARCVRACVHSVVSVIERMRLEDQTERALIQLPNEPKPLGWVTLSKPDGKQNAIVKRGSQLRDTVDGPTAGGMSARRRRQGKRAAAKGSARDNSSLPTTVIAQRVVSPRMLTEEEQACAFALSLILTLHTSAVFHNTPETPHLRKPMRSNTTECPSAHLHSTHAKV